MISVIDNYDHYNANGLIWSELPLREFSILGIRNILGTLSLRGSAVSSIDQYVSYYHR